jgi:hypothetical protein
VCYLSIVAIGVSCHTYMDYLVLFYAFDMFLCAPQPTQRLFLFAILSYCVCVSHVGCSDGSGKAFLQKDRLLQFDRDFARRTEVFDDQEDYQAPSTWMTEEEKKEAEENQLKQLESLKRPKQTLNLAI